MKSPMQTNEGWCWFSHNPILNSESEGRSELDPLLFHNLNLGTLVVINTSMPYRVYASVQDALADLETAETISKYKGKCVVVSAGKMTKETGRSVGWDLYARVAVTVNPGEWGVVPLGIKTSFPLDVAGCLWDKSGYAKKHGLFIIGGLIDGDYPDEWCALVANMGKEPFTFGAGKKVTQVVFLQVSQYPVLSIGEGNVTINDAERTGGFGSTGLS